MLSLSSSNQRLNTNSDIEKLLESLSKKFVLPQSTVLLQASLRKLWESFEGFDSIGGKTLLDLGCGGPYSIESRGQRGTCAEGCFNPWLCRAFIELGGHAVGIDLFGDPREPFDLRRLDLTKEDALSCLPDRAFDAINLRLLLSSPQLARSLPRPDRIVLGERLSTQRNRLLKPHGKVIEWDLAVDEL